MTPTTGCRRARGGLRRLAVAATALAVLSTGACGGGDTPAKPAPKPTATAAPAAITSDQYLTNPMAFNGAVDWTLAKTVKVDLDEMSFAPKDIVVRAGIPYILELKNTGALVHEFTAAEFFKSSSVRKIKSVEGEIRVPYFTGIKVEPGKMVQVFAIPVIPGGFDILCSIKGHLELGMRGRINVIGDRPEVPVPVLGSLSEGVWLQNSAAIIKAAAKTKPIAVEFEAGDVPERMFFAPKDLKLKVNQPYVIQLVNTGTIMHEYTSDEFFPTVAFIKAKDASGEYTSPLLKEAEVDAGKRLDLYIIPTKKGTFKIACKLPGHEEAGMVGTVTVTD